MNPRLLRPILSGDPDALRYIAAVQAADQNTLEPAVRKAITDFVVGCKADGIWSSLKAACFLAGPRTLAGINVPLAGPTPSFNAFTSNEYARSTGLIGNGSSMFIDSNRPGGGAGGDPQDNSHVAVWISSLPSANAGQGAYIGVGGTVGGPTLLFRNSINQHLARSRNATLSSAVTSTTGFFGKTRSSSADFVVRHDGADSTATITSNSPDTGNFYVFARNFTTTLPCDARIAFYSIGESLTLSLLDSRLSTYMSALAAAGIQ